MPATDADGNPLQLNLPPVPSPADVLALAAPDTASQDQSSEQEGGPAKPVRTTPSFPMIYTRPQMLFLQKSPLVKSPPAMPELKQWFGEHEPNPKKDSEPTTPNGTRERRFRRDADDGETSTRPSFRSTLSQPSQMGNFKHQSLRDRDRDGDKDRERDIRDKEGQERLRNLSDKYDRDRLAAPGLRKERDIAPHLAVDSIRGSTSLTAAARRAEARDGSKKKVGEVSEDWRRGSHATRQERNREERPRSRGRDSSRPRRDVSPSRRDRDRDGEDKEPVGDRRDDHRKTTRDDRRTREDHRRERDERRERDRGLDRDAEEDEDPRRWRDDGKRDERMAARRVADKVSQENGDASSDRRWTVVEDRDGRSKRNHRDRRAGGTADDGKDREDRRDRDREREKEPAWMDTYIPESPGIPVGGKGAEGELDGIQAWKKGLKEKEKTAAVPAPKKEEERPAASESVPEKPLDEIQIFRMLMKREEEKKQVDPPPAESSVASAGPPPGIRAKASQGSHTPESAQAVVSDSANSAAPLPSAPPGVPPAPVSSSTPAHDTNSLLAILGKAEPLTRPPPLTNPPPAIDADKIPSQAGSRFFPKPISQQNTTLNAEKPTISDPSAPSAQFNPPPGSRLLAFGTGRGGKSPGLPPTANGLNGLNHPDSVSQHPVLPNANAGALSPDLPINLGPPKSEALRSGFSPFEESRMSFGFEEPRDQFGNAESMRRGDRAPHGLPVEAGPYADPVFDPTSTGYSTGKGSRLAKFFDSKVREAPANQNPAGFASTSPNPGGQRFEGGYNPMDGLLSKLNNSAQIPRPNIMSPNSAASVGGAPFGQQAQNNLQILQQQQQQQQHTQAQHLHLNNRLDSLYESRLDDRNFMPDGMVPGLRSVPPPRNRDSVYSDSLEDSIHFNPNPQRLPPQHHRGLDPMYNPIPSGFAQPGARNIPMQPQFRGAPSPISNQQRLPPGLANLGGRPPLDNSQFMGMPGLPSAGLHSGLHPNGPPQQQQQQQFNNFAVNGNLNNYGGGLQPQMRVPPSQLQGNLQHHQLAGLGHPNIDLQRANQAQLLNLGGGGIRGLGMGGGFGPQQGGPPAQMQQPIHALRQQEQQRQQQQLHQQQQLPPHMLHHHMQVGGHPHQQGIGQSNNNGGDLMALLMGGTAHHRD